MPNLSPTCQKIQNQINALKREKQTLQADLQDASPGQKSAITRDIDKLNQQLDAKKTELAACVKKHPYAPPAPVDPCSNQCADKRKLLEKAQVALRRKIQTALAPLQEELREAGPGQKPGIVRQMRKLRAEISQNSPDARKVADTRDAYYQCIRDCGAEPPLPATFKGIVTVTTSFEEATGPFKENVSIGIEFGAWDHSKISIKHFPPIVVGPYDTFIGDVTTTVTLISGSGSFNAKTRKITLSLSLYFNHSAAVADDSRLDITLQTISALSNKGAIKLDGDSKFQDGYLDGHTCWMTVEGTISPLP